LSKAHEPERHRLGLVHIFLCGLTARGGASEGSDVDFFFD